MVILKILTTAIFQECVRLIAIVFMVAIVHNGAGVNLVHMVVSMPQLIKINMKPKI